MNHHLTKMYLKRPEMDLQDDFADWPRNRYRLLTQPAPCRQDESRTVIIDEIANQPVQDLKPIVNQIAGVDATPLGVSTVKKIGRNVGQGTTDIFHVIGQARTKTGNIEWAAVVKALGKPAVEIVGYRDKDALRELAVCGIYGLPP